MNKLEKEVNIPLPNGYEISLCKSKKGIEVGLVNPNGYIVSDRLLSKEELDFIKKHFK